MKAFKFFLAADDGNGAYMFINRPIYSDVSHAWVDRDSGWVSYLSEHILKQIGISIEDLQDHPCEIIVVALGQHYPDDFNQPL